MPVRQPITKANFIMLTGMFMLFFSINNPLYAEKTLVTYDKGTPKEIGTGRIDNTRGGKTEMTIAPKELTPDGQKVLSCKVVFRGVPKKKEAWRNENLFASVLYLNSPAILKKGHHYLVSIQVKSSKKTPVLITMKDKSGVSAAGFKKSCGTRSEVGNTWKMLNFSFSAGSNWKADELFVQLWFGLLPAGENLQVGPLEIKEIPAEKVLNLSAVANMGLRDEVASDGKGGWSDQGPQNDLRDMTPGRHEFEGVGFDIVNPVKNNGKAVLTFSGNQCKTNLTKAELSYTENNAPTGRYLYLLHTNCWNQMPKGTGVGKVYFKLGNGSIISRTIRTGIDVADWWGAVNLENGKVVYKKLNGSTAVGLYLSKLEIAKSAESIRKITLKTAGKATWIVVAATVSNRDIDISRPPNVVFKANKTWKNVDMSSIQIKAGSALDLSSVSEPGPAGKYGRAVIAKDGYLSFQLQPGKLVRMTGFLMGYWETKALFTYTLPGSTPKQDIAVFARQVHRHGYNVVRMHCIWDKYIMDGSQKDGVPNPTQMNLLYYLISELKKNGVYTYLDIASSQLDYAKQPRGLNTSIMKAGVMIGNEDLRRRWLACAKLMKKVNPYTGMAIIDDPAILCINFFNEQATGVKIMLNGRQNRLPRDILAAYERQWREWNKSNHTPPMPKLYANTPEAANFHRFLTSLSLNTAKWYTARVRELGYKGLVTQYNSNPDIGCSSVRWQESQIVSTNSYHAHPSKGQRKGSICEQVSSIENQAQTWCYANGWRFQDRPIIVSELNHAFWNRYRHEGGLVYPAYAALNRFSGLIWHEGAVDLTVNDKWPRGSGVGVFSVCNSPVSRANAFLSVCLFGRGDVQAAPHRLELQIPSNYLKNNSRGTTNSIQRRIGLLTNFSIAFPGLKPAAEVGTPKPADIRLRPDVGSQVVDGVWFSSSKEAKGSKFSLDAFVKELKAKKILSADNISNPSKGIFQSETGEITMYVKDKLIKVVTPKTEAVSLLAGRTESLDKLKVKKSNVDAMVSVSTMDGKALADSSHIVLLYITEEANTGMEVSHDRSQLFKRGSAPVLMRCGRLSAEFKSNNAEKMELYALGFDGSRRERIPLKKSSGKIAISLDTASLKNGPTPFFELVSEQ